MVETLAVIAAGLFAGALLGMFFGYTPVTLLASASDYQATHGAVSRGYDQAVMALGGATALLFAVCAQEWVDRWSVAAYVIGVALLFSLAVNLRLGIAIRRWQREVPADWKSVRTQWVVGHALRTFAAFIAFALVVSWHP